MTDTAPASKSTMLESRIRRLPKRLLLRPKGNNNRQSATTGRPPVQLLLPFQLCRLCRRSLNAQRNVRRTFAGRDLRWRKGRCGPGREARSYERYRGQCSSGRWSHQERVICRLTGQHARRRPSDGHGEGRDDWRGCSVDRHQYCGRGRTSAARYLRMGSGSTRVFGSNAIRSHGERRDRQRCHTGGIQSSCSHYRRPIHEADRPGRRRCSALRYRCSQDQRLTFGNGIGRRNKANVGRCRGRSRDRHRSRSRYTRPEA